jgi:DNA repair protein RadC
LIASNWLSTAGQACSRAKIDGEKFILAREKSSRSGREKSNNEHRLHPADGKKRRVTHVEKLENQPASFRSSGDSRLNPNGAGGEEAFSSPSQCEFRFEEQAPRPKRRPRTPQEFKIISLRELSEPKRVWNCETPEVAVEYWRTHIATAPWYSKDQECLVVILLNTRYRVIGHHLVAIGILDQVIIHPRETLRAAIIGAAHSIVIGHNHPSGDPTPSAADISATRDLVRAGQQVRIAILDHIIIGDPGFTSLRKLGMIE